MTNHSLETVLNDVWEITDPLVGKARKALHSAAAWLDFKIDNVGFYYFQPMITMVKKFTAKTVKAIKDYLEGKLLILITFLMTVEAVLDTFLPVTVNMKARVISSKSTTKDCAYVRIKRHLVSISFRPLFQVTQISLLQRLLKKTCRVAIFVSDEFLGEKFTNALLSKFEACMPESLEVAEPGTLRGLAQIVMGSYQEVVTKVQTDATMTKVASYMPALQPETLDTDNLSIAEKKRANARSRFGIESGKEMR